MSTEPRKCPYCGMAMSSDQRTCPDCGNPYPFDDESGGQQDGTRQMPQYSQPEPAQSTPTGRPPRPTNSGSGGGLMAALAPHRTALVLVGVLIAIIVVGYLLFSVAMRYFESGRPEPGSLPNATPAPVVVPSPAVPSPGAGASPSPGTVIQPSASPSPGASGARMKILNTEDQGANMRQRPSTTAPVLRTLPEGTVVEVIGGETNAEGRGWRNVRDAGGATGWVASELLGPE